MCISKFHILAANHFSSYICDLFIKLSSYDEKKILMSTLIKDKNIVNLNNYKNRNYNSYLQSNESNTSTQVIYNTENNKLETFLMKKD